jgi:hypothetical protein
MGHLHEVKRSRLNRAWGLSHRASSSDELGSGIKQKSEKHPIRQNLAMREWKPRPDTGDPGRGFRQRRAKEAWRRRRIGQDGVGPAQRGPQVSIVEAEGSALPPSLSISSAAEKIVPGSFGWGSTVLAAMAMFAPSRAALSPIASPMPREAPVMNSVLPARVPATAALPTMS